MSSSRHGRHGSDHDSDAPQPYSLIPTDDGRNDNDILDSARSQRNRDYAVSSYLEANLKSAQIKVDNAEKALHTKDGTDEAVKKVNLAQAKADLAQPYFNLNQSNEALGALTATNTVLAAENLAYKLAFVALQNPNNPTSVQPTATSATKQDWQPLSTALSIPNIEYMTRLADFCTAGSKELSESVIPTLYHIASEDSFALEVLSINRRYQIYLQSNSWSYDNMLSGRPPTNTDNASSLRHLLSYHLQSRPNEAYTIKHHKLAGSLGRVVLPQMLPSTVSLIQHHCVPYQLAALKLLRNHFDKKDHLLLSSILDVSLATINAGRINPTPKQNEQLKLLKSVEEACYNLYSRPYGGSKNLPETFTVSNVMAISDQAGLAKSESLKNVITGALALNKPVLFSDVNEQILSLALFSPSGQHQIKTIPLSKSYPDYLATLKREIEGAFSKFTDLDIVVTDPMECDPDTEFGPSGGGLLGVKVVEAWVYHHRDLGTRFPSKLFFAAHSTPHIPLPDQGKSLPIIDPFNYYNPLYFMTFLCLEPTHDPLIHALKDLVDSMHVEPVVKKNYLHLVDKMSSYCLPNMSNILHFFNLFQFALGRENKKFAEMLQLFQFEPLDQSFMTTHKISLQFELLDQSYMERHHIFREALPTANQHNQLESEKQTQRMENGANFAPLELSQAFLRSSVTHSHFEQSVTNLSPFLYNLKYQTRFTPPRFPEEYEDRLYNHLSCRGGFLLDSPVTQCIDLHWFGVKPESRPILQSNNISIGKSTTVLNLAEIDTFPIDEIVPSKSEHHQKLIAKAMYWLAKAFLLGELDPMNGLYVRLPSCKDGFDALQFHPRASKGDIGPNKVTAIQISVDNKKQSEHKNHAENYQNIFAKAKEKATENAIEKATVDNISVKPYTTFEFTPLHLKPCALPNNETLVRPSDDDWVVRYSNDFNGLDRLTQNPLEKK